MALGSVFEGGWLNRQREMKKRVSLFSFFFSRRRRSRSRRSRRRRQGRCCCTVAEKHRAIQPQQTVLFCRPRYVNETPPACLKRYLLFFCFFFSFLQGPVLSWTTASKREHACNGAASTPPAGGFLHQRHRATLCFQLGYWPRTKMHEFRRI